MSTTPRWLSILAASSLAATLGATAAAGPAQGSPARPHLAAQPTATDGPGLIVFSADATGSYQLYTVSGDGGGLTQITHLANSEATQADWSPDGRHIVFELDTPTAGRIAVVDFDGANMRTLPRLAPAGGSTGQPSYSANGRRIYFERYDGGTDDAIYSATLKGLHPKRLTNPPDGYGDTDPNVSPDGTMLSFVRLGPVETDSALMVLDLGTRKVKRLTPFSEDVAIKQSWAPNGRRIAYSRDAYSTRDGVSANVMSIKPDATRRHAVTAYAGGSIHAFFGSYSPDGQWILYREEHTDLWPLMVIRPDGSHAHPILDVDGLRPRGSDWSTGPGVG
jgi:Tol biopolymer transport system component